MSPGLKVHESWALFIRPKKTWGLTPPMFLEEHDQAEKDDPQPHVVVALGFFMTNWEPCKSSL